MLSARHIPFRDSKLTRLLSDALGGNSLTLLIANISPTITDITQSVSTLKFASRAKTVKTQPKRIEISQEDEQEMVKLQARLESQQIKLTEVERVY